MRRQKVFSRSTKVAFLLSLGMVFTATAVPAQGFLSSLLGNRQQVEACVEAVRGEIAGYRHSSRFLTLDVFDWQRDRSESAENTVSLSVYVEGEWNAGTYRLGHDYLMDLRPEMRDLFAGGMAHDFAKQRDRRRLEREADWNCPPHDEWCFHTRFGLDQSDDGELRALNLQAQCTFISDRSVTPSDVLVRLVENASP